MNKSLGMVHQSATARRPNVVRRVRGVSHFVACMAGWAVVVARSRGLVELRRGSVPEVGRTVWPGRFMPVDCVVTTWAGQLDHRIRRAGAFERNQAEPKLLTCM